MTLTSHGHHIPRTPVVDVAETPLNCGGPGVCDDCTFEIQWFKNRDEKRALIFPSDETVNLDSQILRKISAKIRSQNPKPKPSMLVREHILSRNIHALADALDSVANDLNGL